MSTMFIAMFVSALLLLMLLALGIIFGGPREPAPMDSIYAPFKDLDYSLLPILQRCHMRDRIALAYRCYPAQHPHPNGARSIVFVHGSSASSKSMHQLGLAFANAGYTAYTLDMRGHGASGEKGQVRYIGQLEDDLADFMQSMSIKGMVSLAGFSSGGGFVLRFAGSQRQHLFNNYLLLSPFISQTAASQRLDSGGWVKVGVPRVVALLILNSFGIRWFNALSITRFALNEEAKQYLTPSYGFNLAQNFRPMTDYRANIAACKQTMSLLAGAEDEAFHADQFAQIFASAGKPIPVEILPGLGHIALSVDPRGTQAAVAAVEKMYASPSGKLEKP